METKLVVLIFIALLAGLGGGYGLGNAIYQPQIQSLQSSIASLETTLDNLNGEVEKINSALITTNSSLEILGTELDTLNQDVTNIDSELNEIENRTWHRADYEELAGIAPATIIGENFQIKGNWIRIRWIADASYYTLADFMESWITVSVRFSNGTEYTHRKTFVGTFSSMSTDMDIILGEYYLQIDIGSAIAKIVVVVWDYY